MNNSDTISNTALRGATLRSPLLPARFVALGTEQLRTQRSGGSVLFRAVTVRTEFLAVPSRLDGYSSTWFTAVRSWVPVDALIDGQLELTRQV